MAVGTCVPFAVNPNYGPLVGCDPELLRRVHAPKVAFDGEIVALGMGGAKKMSVGQVTAGTENNGAPSE